MDLVCSASVFSAIAMRSLQQLRDTPVPPFTTLFSARCSNALWAAEVRITHYWHTCSIVRYKFITIEVCLLKFQCLSTNACITVSYYILEHFKDRHSHTWTHVGNTPKINLVYLGKRKICCILKTCCIVSILFSTKWHSFHKFIFLCQIILKFFTNHALIFKHPLW